MAETLVLPWAAPRPPGRFRALLRLLRLWIVRAGWRRDLADLDAMQMRDCGLDPVEVRCEAAKPFWRD